MWSALSTSGRGEGVGRNCSCTCPGLWSGPGLAEQLPQRGVVNGNRQRNLWRSESVRNYLKYLLAFSSWNICEAPPPSHPPPTHRRHGHVLQTMQCHATLARYWPPSHPLSTTHTAWKNAAECFLELLSLCSAQRRLCFNLCSMFWHFLNCIPPLLYSPFPLLKGIILCTNMLALAIS